MFLPATPCLRMVGGGESDGMVVVGGWVGGGGGPGGWGAGGCPGQF